MKAFLTLGKALTALFWGIVLANVLQPFAQPFAFLLYGVGVLVLLIHGVELWLFNKRLAACPKPVQARVQVMLFGVFQLFGLPLVEAQTHAALESEGVLQLEVENA